MSKHNRACGAHLRSRYKTGFTVIELLIVVVIIGILATIIIIAYIGIQNKAQIAVITSDLDSTSKQLAITNASGGSFPSSLSALNNGNGPQSSGTAYQYTYYSATNTYCVTGIIGGNAYMITDSSQPTLGVCPGHTGPSGTKVNGGVVTTFAGSVTGNLDGTGTAAKFSYPDGITMDSSGNFYIADRGNSTIRKMTASGVVTTFAGSGVQGSANGTGVAAQFYYPEGIAVDSSNNLYVTDRANNLIRKITSGGVVTTLAGQTTAGNVDGMGGSAQLNTPYGLVVTPSSDLYIADYGNNTIRKITAGGNVTTFAGDGVLGYIDATGIAAELRHPFGIALDSLGNFYVTDRSNYRIREITPSGVVTTLAGSGTLGGVDGTGTAAQFYYSQGVVVDGPGALYVVDQGDHRIRKIQ